MRQFNSILFLLLLVFGAPICRAQIHHFENFAHDEGLIMTQVLCGYTHDDGTIWFGTHDGGFVKFDGTSFTSVTQEQGLIGNTVYNINRIGNKIFISTNQGLSVLENGEFTNYGTDDGLKHSLVWSTYADHTGKIYIGTHQGINFYEDGKITSEPLDSILDKAIIFRFFEDSKNQLWIGTMKDGLFEVHDNHVTNYRVSDDFYNWATSMIETEEGLLVGTKGGLRKIENQELVSIHTDMFGSPYQADGKHSQIYDLKLDHNNVLWLGTDDGAFKYEDGKFEHYSMTEGIISNSIWSIVEDNENNKWFLSNDHGISKLRSEMFLNYNTSHGLNNNGVKFIQPYLDHTFIIGTDKGLNLFKDNQIRPFDIVDEKSIAQMGLTRNSAIVDSDSSIWIGANFGVIHVINGKSYNYKIKPGHDYEEYSKAYDMAFDQNHNLILATIGGLAHIENGHIVPLDTSAAASYKAYSLFESSAGDLWVGTDQGAVQIRDNKHVKFNANDGFTNDRVRTIIENEDGVIIFGTNDGIYFKDGDTFVTYNDSLGLQSSQIYSLAYDSEGMLWAGMPDGVQKLKFSGTKLMATKYFTRADGYMGEEAQPQSIAVDNQGNVLFGGNNGLVKCQHKNEKINLDPPKLRIEHIKLFNSHPDWLLHTDQVDLAGLPLNLELANEYNHLTFSFIGVNLTAPEKVRYQYQLIGQEETWHPVTAKTEANYNNLAPGTYQFRVISCNGEGIWNNDPVTFDFEILPPFYKTWWFYSICLLIFFGFVYSYFRIRVAHRQILFQKVEIERKNVGLNLANEEINRQQKDILDSIHYAENIQRAMLPDDAEMNGVGVDSAVLFKPKDIVSGDFYYYEQHEGELYFSAADCTGHGVPGAFMSFIGNTGITQAIHQFGNTLPGEILSSLDTHVKDTLKKSIEDSDSVNDGMDMCFCKYNPATKEIYFAGALNSLMVISRSAELQPNEFTSRTIVAENDENLFLHEIKGDRSPIGSFYQGKEVNDYRTVKLQLKEGDLVYISSDGYPDQFGGPKGKKFTSKRFKKLLLSICDLPTAEQIKQLDIEFEKWKEHEEQLDDVCVIALRV